MIPLAAAAAGGARRRPRDPAVAGYPFGPGALAPAWAGETISREFDSHATTIDDGGTGSYPRKTGGAEGWDTSERNWFAPLASPAYASLVTDLTAPFSGDSVLHLDFPSGLTSTFSPARILTSYLVNKLGTTTPPNLYLRFALWLSSDFYGHDSSGHLKLCYLQFCDTSGAGMFEPFWPRLEGTGANPLYLTSGIGSMADTRMQTPGNLTDHVAGQTGEVTRGAWHDIEIIVRMNSAMDVADGVFQMGVDGVLTTDYQDLVIQGTNPNNSTTYTGTELYGVKMEVIWGGGATTASPNASQMRINSLYVATGS